MFKKLFGNLALYGLSNIVRSISPLLLLPILTLHLTPAEFGQLSIVETVILFAVPLISLSLNSYISVSFNKSTNNELGDMIWTGFFVLILSTSFFVFVFISTHDFFYFNDVWEFWLILFIPIFCLIKSIPLCFLSILQMQGKPKLYLFVTILSVFLDIVFTYFFVVSLELSLDGRLAGFYLANFIICLLTAFYVFQFFGRVRFKKEQVKGILNYGVHLVPHALCGTIIALSDRFFLLYYMGTEEVANYTAAYQVSSILLLFGVAINQAWTPLCFNLFKKVVEFKTYILYLLPIVFMIVCFFFILTLNFQWIYQILISESLYDGIKYHFLLLIGFLFQSIYFISSSALFYEKKNKILSSLTFIFGILNLVMNYFLFSWLGSIGVALSTAITWFGFSIMSIILTVYLKKEQVIKCIR
ncbi:TPA: oligosaccharide flippase family protein [Vibrio parahaemolyticus]|nr:oligosaccharide flippase family protein [Vibrio parahaemolyticus]